MAGVAGLVLAATTAWWLVALGLVCIVAAWFYTGGSKPYGYLGLGEVMVFVFFGLVAVVGTTYVQTETFELARWPRRSAIGCLACAILVANNLRDIPTDTTAGKRTLAVVLGDRRTRYLYVGLVEAALVATWRWPGDTTWWALLGSCTPPRRAPRPRPCSRAPRARTWCRCSSRPGSAELLMGVRDLRGPADRGRPLALLGVRVGDTDVR